tara:strand:- start:64 stop:435 length:372 start_codon:yes stop_codon:yes gene_type:complete
MSNVIRFGSPETYFSREHGIAPGRHESVTSIRLGSPPDDASEEQRFWYLRPSEVADMLKGDVVGYIFKHARLGAQVSAYAVTAPDYDIDAVEFFPGDYATGARGALAAAKAYARKTILQQEGA